MLNRILCYVFISAVSIALLPVSGIGAEDSSAIDAEADKVMRQMIKYQNSLAQFNVHIDKTTEEIISTGQKLQYGGTVDLVVRRPDRFRVEIRDDTVHQHLFYDGKSISLYGKRVNYYATMNAPDTIKAALEHALKSFNLTAPLADFIVKSSYEEITENVETGFYVGLSNIRGVECHHLAFRQHDIDWQIWIENSETPRPRKIIITSAMVTGAPQFTAWFTDWDSSPKLKDSMFTFVPPEKVKKIEFLPVDKSAMQDN